MQLEKVKIMGNTISFNRVLAEIRGEEYRRLDYRKNHHGSTEKRYKSGKSGHKDTKFEHAHFIAWDGEGIDSEKESIVIYDQLGNIIENVQYQTYALLMNSEGVMYCNVDGISTYKALELIMNSTDDKQAIHVCYGASYDSNMILHGVSMDIPESDLRKLHSGKSIDFDKFQLVYRPHKSLEIREYMSIFQKYRFNEKTGKREGWFKKSVIIWDVFSFFQCSFVEALEKYFIRGNRLPEDTKEEWKLIIQKIKAGKDLRGTFTEDELWSFVKPYTELEVWSLNKLMIELRNNLEKAGIQVMRWDGAGACASALLKKYKVKPHISDNNIPNDIIVAAEYAFFGGRIEVLQYGNYDNGEPVYHKDINSAYPDVLRLLPSLAQGTWFHHNVENVSFNAVKNTQFVSLFLVSWHMKNLESTICPFPWRDKIGNVFFPPIGKAWIYKPELEMALKHFSKGKYKCDIYIHEYYEFVPATDYKPFHFIPEIYELRKLLIALNQGGEKELKLAINALYGKTAQSVGYSTERGKGKPPYHNMIIAGMTTSYTRAKLMKAAMQCPDSVIMLATDGIYSTSDIDVSGKDSHDKVLGEWEHSTHDYITIVASGVYWYGGINESENAFSRGFNKYSIMRQMVLDAWKNGETLLKCETTRFVGLGSAIGLNSFDYWCTWRTIQRELCLNMDKVAKRVDIEKKNPVHGLVKTIAAIPRQLEYADTVFRFPYIENAILSHKYSFKWDNTNRVDMIDGINMREYLEEVTNTLA